MRKSLAQLNLPRYCSELGVPLASCPPFLFIIMGVVVIGAILGTYAVAQRYAEPEIAVLIMLALAAFLFVVGYLIIGAFEKLADSRARERRQATELLTLKDQFVFLAAHELRAPATAIKWAVESLETNTPELVSKNKEEIRLIVQNTMRLLGLVHDILETARLESQALRISLQPTQLGDIIEQATSSVRNLAQAHGVTVVSRLEGNVPRVSADPLRLGAVFTNLLSNAIKFSERGSEVEITALTSEKTVAVDVVDHGVGIAKDDQPHIFEKFWHGVGTIVSVEHSGLGLFITKQLVQLMGGSIRFASEQGEGSTFTVELKRAEG
ncbi:MAG: HAMP domain-containing sensor histidine kinase [bacterium]|nr:HAMP domain-containing sensor histidine kinase [bacterium]MDZ4284726.1 HAMP domain-containing sensor histidine kinase [Patescibacteria group bacterium]